MLSGFIPILGMKVPNMGMKVPNMGMVKRIYIPFAMQTIFLNPVLQ